MNPNYDKSVADQIIALLKESVLRDTFKSFYYGDPIDIPISAMPCLVVEIQQTDIDHGPTGMDEITSEVLIKLICNKRDDFGKSAQEVVGQRKLEEWAQGLSTSSDQFASQTVAGIMRKNFTLNNTSTNQTMSIRYGVTPRPNETLTAEAHITFMVEQLVQVENRV